MPDIVTTAVTSFLGGGVLVEIIRFIGDRRKYKEQRETAKEDREAKKEDKTEELGIAVNELREADKVQDEQFGERIATLERLSAALVEALRLILLDRILYLGQHYVAKGEITFDDRRRLHEMHDCYHNGLGGNGDAKLIMEAVDELPLKK